MLTNNQTPYGSCCLGNWATNSTAEAQITLPTPEPPVSPVVKTIKFDSSLFDFNDELFTTLYVFNAPMPECIMQSLKASAMSNWMLLYRKLEQLHGLLEDNLPAPDADEYYAIVRKLVRMAETVATHASVQINAASMFTLLLMQAHLHKYAPTRRKATRRNTKAKKAKKPKKSSKTDK